MLRCFCRRTYASYARRLPNVCPVRKELQSWRAGGSGRQFSTILDFYPRYQAKHPLRDDKWYEQTVNVSVSKISFLSMQYTDTEFLSASLALKSSAVTDASAMPFLMRFNPILKSESTRRKNVTAAEAVRVLATPGFARMANRTWDKVCFMGQGCLDATMLRWGCHKSAIAVHRSLLP
ncbi:hypothetical protein C8T65DRAFT_697729 [Cerioporus squamosus]|nr:hypothetical protein C8T65DRAFT_697729 [Cerioporus squamosus]